MQAVDKGEVHYYIPAAQQAGGLYAGAHTFDCGYGISTGGVGERYVCQCYPAERPHSEAPYGHFCAQLPGEFCLHHLAQVVLYRIYRQEYIQ